VVLGAGIEMNLLRAPERRRRQILVGTGLELDMALLDELLGRPQRLVEAAQGRAAIAGDVACRIEPRRLVALALHHRQPDQRLRAGQVDPAAFQYVFVVQGYSDGHSERSLTSIWGP